MNKQLGEWYQKNKRPLPWRKSKDPYRIWISEIMLQQTTVQAMIPYYEKFLERFPTVEVLAEAPEDEVLGLWSGLGYYSRARNLHKAARQIVKLGFFPSTYDTLLELPGIGPYTAAAIASIAFDERVPVVDGNVQRALSRVFNIAQAPHSTEGKKFFLGKAREFLGARAKPGEHNQAVMELGATVCTPQNPACLICPLMNDCIARQKGLIDERPIKKPRRQNEDWIWEMYIAQRGDKIALTQESRIPWLKGLWLLPGKATPLKSEAAPKSYSFKHQITHHRIFVQLKSVPASRLPTSIEVKWVPKKNLQKHGLSSVVKKALALLD